jgi:hypothetical protein
MSLATSRYESQNIVNSFNLFVDSERSSVYGHGHSKGDDVHIHMEGNSIEAMDGEIIRLTLTNFTMFNNLYHIDNTNRRIRLLTNGASNTSNDRIIRLTRQNHKDYNSIVKDFATVLGTALVAEAKRAGATSVTKFKFDTTEVQPPEASLSASNSRLMVVTLTARTSSDAAVNHSLNDVIIQCQGAAGESYQILGGERIDDVSDLTSNSFEVNVTAQTVVIKGYFPMQRMSDPYIYLRCENVSNGLEMSVLDSAIGAAGPDVINSNILAKVFRDVEFASYHTQTGDDYFLNLQQRRLSHLHLFLTDSKGRRLGRLPGATSGSAAGLEDNLEGVTSVRVTNGGTGYASPPTVTISGGTELATATAVLGTGSNAGTVVSVIVGSTGGGFSGTVPTVAFSGGGGSNAAAFANLGNTRADSFVANDQSTQGNLYFTAVLKVEVIRVRNPAHLDTVPPPFPKPAREAQGVVVWPDYGRPRH